jgi:(p)ppGpp synthase/HD superfamily hydrolase
MTRAPGASSPTARSDYDLRSVTTNCDGCQIPVRTAERSDDNSTVLGECFQRALVFACELHRDQVRKGSKGIPYIAHLLGVASIVIEDGGDEDEAIAALLHDGPEDRGGRATLERIRHEFGDRVADIVEGCSDTLEDPKPPWRERKEAYLVHLEEAPDEVLRVSLADKVHNARAILSDYREVGEELWSRFNGTREESLWYYRSLVEIFARRCSGPLAEELETTVNEIEALAG